MEKRKYEITQVVRFERRKTLKIGAVVDLDGQQAAELAHAIKLLPDDVQGQPEEEPVVSTQEQDPQEQPTATEDGAAEPGDDSPAGENTSEEAPEARVEAQQEETVLEDAPEAAGEETFVDSGEPRITDGAREEAERLGISLEHVRATGVHNTLTKKDVQRENKRIQEAKE